MPDPLISLIIPVYNVEPYLPTCLNSVIKQSYKNLEIILVNDGSTDNSKSLCEEYLKKDNRIILINQKNQGLSSARNTGLKKAKGSFISFIDSDDYVERGYVSYLYGLIKESDAKISICPHYEKTESEKLRNFNQENFISANFSVETALKNMLNERGFNLQSTSKLYSSGLFKSVEFPKKRLHEDVGTTYKLFLEAYKKDKNTKIAFGSNPKYVYVLHPSSISNFGFSPKKLDLIELTDKMCKDLDETFPKLKDTTNLRRVHARFSILRQITKSKNKTDEEKKIETSLVKYIKSHKTWVSDNPEATPRDKLALATLLLGKPVFKFAWNVYEKRKK